MFTAQQLQALNTLSDRAQRCLGLILVFQNPDRDFVLTAQELQADLKIYPAQMSHDEIVAKMSALVTEMRTKLYPAFNLHVGDNDEAEFEKTVEVSY